MKKLTLEEAKAKFPVDTPVWYFPVNNDTATKTATWVRCTPFCAGALGDVVVQVANQINTVSVDHLQLRDVGEKYVPDSLKAPNITEQMANFCERHGVEPALLRQLARVEMNDEARLNDELQELGETFGCPGGMNRIKWLRQRLTLLAEMEKAPPEPPAVIYQYSASLNTPRGTVQYDGIVERPCFIRSIGDYLEIRQQIATDSGTADPDAVNILNLSIAGGELYERLTEKQDVSSEAAGEDHMKRLVEWPK